MWAGVWGWGCACVEKSAGPTNGDRRRDASLVICCRRGGSPYQRVWGGADGQGVRRPAAKPSGAARRRQRIGPGPDGRPRQRPHSMSTQRSATGRGAAPKSRRVASSAVLVQSAGSRQAAPLANGLPEAFWTIEEAWRSSSPCAEKRLVPQKSRVAAPGCGATFFRLAQHRPGQLGLGPAGAGRCLGSPPPARTGWAPP